MGRYLKSGFEYFPLDTNLFGNKKIKALKRAYGAIGVLTYIYILCYAYGHDGFFIHLEDREQFCYDIAESIVGEQISKVATRVNESISYLSVLGLIDGDSLERNTITGVNIQRQYLQMVAQSKRKFDKKALFLLSDKDFSVTEKSIYAEEMGIYSEEISKNSEEMQQSKVNKIIKEKIIKKKVSTFDIQTHNYDEDELESLVTPIDKLEF